MTTRSWNYTIYQSIKFLDKIISFGERVKKAPSGGQPGSDSKSAIGKPDNKEELTASEHEVLTGLGLVLCPQGTKRKERKGKVKEKKEGKHRIEVELRECGLVSQRDREKIDSKAETLEQSEVIKHSLYFVRSILLFLGAQSRFESSGLFEKVFIGDLVEPVSRLIKAKDSAILIGWIKYICCFPLARSISCGTRLEVTTHQDLPPQPKSWTDFSSVYLYEGRIGKFLKNRFQGRCTKFVISLGFGWLQTKRGTATVSEKFVEEQVVKHYNSMNCPPPVAEGIIHGAFERKLWAQRKYLQSKDNYLKKLDTILDIIIPAIFPRKLKRKDWTEVEASRSAHYESSRKEGGGRHEVRIALVRRELGLEKLFQTHPEYRARIREECIKKLDELELEEGHSLFRTYDQYSETFMESISGLDPNLDRDLTEMIYEEIKLRPLSARVVGLKEPIKTRVLTCGESLPYFYSKDLQKWMHSSMRELAPFRLLGETLERQHLYDLVLKHRKSTGPTFDGRMDTLDGGEYFLSGDYSQATDLLDPEITKLIFEKVLDQAGVFNLRERAIYRSCLYEHLLEYRERRDGKMTSKFILQKKGQLMGSVLSFPILCLFNLLTFLTSCPESIFETEKFARVDRYGIKTYKKMNPSQFNEIPVLINGDDISFVTTRVHDEFWTRAIDLIGFKKSTGKNYTSPKFVTINSMMFYFSNGNFEKLEFPNTGLLLKIPKTGVTDDTVPFWDVYNNCRNGYLNCENWFRAHFFRYWSKTIDFFTKGGLYNLFIPRELGGCGLMGKAKDYTRFQTALTGLLATEQLQTKSHSKRRQGMKAVTKNEERQSSTVKYSGPSVTWERTMPLPKDFEEVDDFKVDYPCQAYKSSDSKLSPCYPLSGKKIPKSFQTDIQNPWYFIERSLKDPIYIRFQRPDSLKRLRDHLNWSLSTIENDQNKVQSWLERLEQYELLREFYESRKA